MTAITQNKPVAVPAAPRLPVPEKKSSLPTTAARAPALKNLKDGFEKPSASKAPFRLDGQPVQTNKRLSDLNLLQRGESVQITRPHTTKSDEMDRLKTAHVTELITDARTEFESASKEAEKADKELAKLITGFGPALTADEQQRAIQAFKDSRADVYKRADDAAGKLVDAINNAPQNREIVYDGFKEAFDQEVEKAKDMLPQLANTERGRDAIADAVAALGTDEQGAKSSILLTAAGDVRQALQGADIAITKSVGQRLLSLSKDNVGDAQKLFDGLKRAGPAFGVSNEDISKISDNLKDVAQGKPGAVDTLKKTIDTAKVDVPGGSTDTRRDAFKALGVAATAVSLISGNPTKEDPATIVKATAQALQIGADGGSLVTGVLSTTNPGRFAGLAKVFEGVGGIGGVVGGIADIITSGKSFSEGDVAKGISSLSAGVGGIITAAGGVVGIPVVGQIAGGLLAVGGFVAGFIIDAIREAKEEKVAEESARKYLEGGGVPAETSSTLADLQNKENVGPAIVQVAKLADVDPVELLRTLDHKPVEEVRQFVDLAQSIPRNPDGTLQLKLGDYDNIEYDSSGSARASSHPIHSLEQLQQWLVEHNALPQVAKAPAELGSLLPDLQRMLQSLPIRA